MSEKNTKKQRYSLLKLFPDAKGDVVKRIGTVSRKIRFDKPPIHPIYGLAWYAFVEELFIHNQTDQLQIMSDFLKNPNNFGLRVDQSQQVQINSTIQWLDELIKICLDQHFLDQKRFNYLYSTLFYTRVFKEYADDTPQLSSSNQQPFYLEDIITLVSRLFIAKEFSQRSNNDQLNPEEKKDLYLHFFLLKGDENFEQNNQYLAGIDTKRIESLSFFYKFSFRLYQEINGQISTFAKVSRISTDKINLGLGFILCNEDSYCIAYDQTLEAQYYMFSHYKKRNQRVNEGYYKLYGEIQEKKMQILQLLNQEQAQYQDKVQQILLLLNQNKNQASVEKQNEMDLENRLSNLEINLSELKKSGDLIHQELQKKQIQKNIKIQATQSYYSKENNFFIKYKNDLAMKKLDSQNQQTLLEKKRKEYQEYISANKNTIELTNFNKFQGKYTSFSALKETSCMIPNVEKKLTCQICADEKNISEMIIMSCCGYATCIGCMRSAFETNLSTLESLKCLNQNCQQPFRDLVPFYSQGILSDQNLRRLTEKMSFMCPDCKTKFQLQAPSGQQSKLPTYIRTPCCNKEICRYCLQFKHKNGQYCTERVKSYLQNIKGIIQAINQNLLKLNTNPSKQSAVNLNREKEELQKQRRFRFCPDCSTLLFKDNHCEATMCPFCQLKLCFTCAAPRQPTMDHDNSYHRQGCKYYHPENPRDPRQMKPNCAYCQKKGSVCDLPASWQDYQQQVRSWYGDAFFTEEFAFNWNDL